MGEAGGVIDKDESEEVRDALGLDRLCQRPRHLPIKCQQLKGERESERCERQQVMSPSRWSG